MRIILVYANSGMNMEYTATVTYGELLQSETEKKIITESNYNNQFRYIAHVGYSLNAHP